ncbi:PDZ domain-containing protein sprite isoform X2 [Lycorma delicatula]|uniref:PDZ domain-containing protein sprite isoform X2 n=1 Tax=Lycorma delicatula TaxID=130591 RepID=UPI003F515F0B
MTRMGSAAQLGDTTARRFSKGIRSSKKSSVMYSDYYDDEKDESNNGLANQRSISLMASIEVSLSTTPRRKKAGSGANTPTPTAVNTPCTTANNSTTNIYRTSKDIAKELEMLRNTLRDKENVIHSLKGQLCTSLNISRLSATYLQRQNHKVQPLTEKEKKAAEERLNKLRTDLDAKRLAIKNIKLALERLDITDNIDVRIQQAELEYQLGREELNLLSILEESRNLQACLEDAAHTKESATLFSYMKDSSAVTLHAVELGYDPKSPRFGAGPKEDSAGLFVEWATEDSGLLKGDRILEVNGKIVLVKNKEDMLRLLSVSPDPAQLVVMRKQPSHLDQLMSSLQAELCVVREKASEAERTRDSFRSDNVRLTHRISYLEEQVAELLDRVRDEEPKSPVMSSASSVKSNHTAPASPKPEVQVFQKGPQVTALVANLPGLEVGSKSQSESVAVLPTMKPKQKSSESCSIPDTRSVKSLDLCLSENNSHKIQRNRHHKPEINLQNAQSTNSLDVEIKNVKKHHHFHHHHHHHQNNNHSFNISELDKGGKTLDYSSESSLIDRKPHNRHHSENHRLHLEQRQRHIREARSSLFDYIERDKRSSKSLDFDSESSYNNNTNNNNNNSSSTNTNSNNKSNSHHSHQSLSNQSLDYNSESSLRHYIKHSEPRMARPIPPKKPLRLSLHRAASLQSVESNNEKKPMKRNHKGEAPPVPHQSALNWPSPTAALHTAATLRNKVNTNEKWC